MNQPITNLVAVLAITNAALVFVLFPQWPPILLLVAYIGPFIYWMPAIVAEERSHRNRWAIFVLTLFTAPTGIGWIVALVWACTSGK